MSARRPQVAIVGAGGLARALASALLLRRGVRLTVAARRPAAAAGAIRGLRGVLAAPTIADAVATAEIVILAVPDRAIAEVARSCVPMRRSWRGIVVLHAAGAHGPQLLDSLEKRGAATGVWHPLAVLGALGGQALAGSFARIEGTPKARSTARRLCALAGLTPLSGSFGSRGARGRYHAAASLASNDVVALLSAALDLLVRDGVPPRSARAALAALASGALAQFLSAGPKGALTGPVARGDAATLAAQLRALFASDPAAAEAHRALSLRLLELKTRSGRTDPRAAEALRLLLGRGRGRPRTV